MTQVRQQNIVGRWCPSAGATGFRLVDRSGRGNHGVLINMNQNTSWQANDNRLALNTNNVGYVEATNPVLVNNARFTLAIWVVLNALGGSGNSGIFTVGGSGTASGPYEMLYSNSNIVTFGTSGNGWCTFPSPTFGQWAHLVCVQNGTTAGSSSVFVNGIQITPNTNVAPSIIAFGTRTFLGLRREGTGLANMVFDDAIFFNTALTASEVREIYRRGRGYGIGANPHRSRRSAASATNRRRRLICGSNC